LTVLTTIVVGVVADGAGGEFTGCGVATGVGATAGGAAAVAFFALFDYAVATFATGDEGDVFVRGEAGVGGGFGEETVADVADGAGGETIGCIHSCGIHLLLEGGQEAVYDILLIGIADCCTERTTHLCRGTEL
jgi:hypothetical protein